MRYSIPVIAEQFGRVAIVTGSNSGIGLETARALASKGAVVVLACRSQSKAESARENILKLIPKAELKILPLDISDLDSVKRFAAEFKQTYRRLDLLINNAGVMALPFGKTAQGFEMVRAAF